MVMSLTDRLKGMVSIALLNQVVKLVEEGNDEKLASLFDTISRLAPAKFQRETFREMAQMARENHPFVGVFRRVFQELHPNCRKKLIVNLIVNFMVLSRGIRDRKMRELDIHIPNFMVISPTMRCNLKCKGCYAGSYDTSTDLTAGEIDDLITQAKELGMYFFTISGGEPFTRKDLFDIWAKHDDCYFQVYTNGTLITDEVADKLVELGNVAPMISIEGTPEETEYRRGQGMYGKIIETYRRLRRKGVLYGFSATCTRSSASYISSDEFIERMLEEGCKVGWFFQYIPTGLNPDLSYMATPEQRAHLKKKVEEWRSKYPIFLGDFWNDGPYVDGCIAAGFRYLHVISNGDVEPCVFCHFAVDNIREKSLVEVLSSPFFEAIRSRQPYDDDNLLRPCLIIDHPAVLRELVIKYGAHPTHPGADKLLDELASGLDEYARRMKEIYDPIWEERERQKYLKNLEKEDNPDIKGRYEKRCVNCGTKGER
ncbi:Radical SAM superfamily enzyme, MoaA/NifB/PqqE/SkfB family [Acetomicrobium thermoterrenum DSM 13490]|uniref:Radical SAM superfamily enzyme, MoaA/NifB/PqqE/SkfB family n=1 Tax=Acetomicrobium thermoterrenum DSM 13490 TaxID=1120987 RepID=A0A1H3DCG5_9BACT|nr:radical SAM protein [Acetomicrobium thermoterrenum]SDX64105.1 Radical SAM superfamily enzyme, MoaA/NifB/PqqE/SkfB family [Acetomicrobium thermoterrenum DSM 13490]